MNFGNMAALMQKASKMQKSLQELEKTFETQTFEGVSGGNLIKVTINGKFNIVSIDIDDSLIEKEEKAMLSDLIAAAFNNAKAKADETKKEKLQSITGGLPIPPGLGF